MPNVVVAGTKKHAEAMIKWLKLDPDIWDAMAYGDSVIKTYYSAKIVRPVEGVEKRHYDWLVTRLIPSVRDDGNMVTVPPSWRLPEPDEIPNDVSASKAFA